MKPNVKPHEKKTMSTKFTPEMKSLKFDVKKQRKNINPSSVK